MQPSFRALRQGDPDYEAIRCGVVWNGFKPERYPEIIVQVKSEAEVVEAVKYAAEHNLKIGVRSGGHSWTASFLRNGGMLIDVSQLNSVNVDPKAGVADVGPGAHGGDLNEQLKPHDYMFPAGHCPTVGLGGYLLQGGFGWNSRLYGLGCENVLAIDVVVSDGRLLHADANQNEELLWAARGSGCGFFGVITRYYLRCHPLPKAIMNSRYWFSLDHLDEIVKMLDSINPSFPRHLEVSLFIARDQDELPGLTAQIRADCLGSTPAEAREALDSLDQQPLLSKALKSVPFHELDLAILLETIGGILEVNNAQFIVDNTWMNEPVASILPQLHEMIHDLGPAPSHLYIQYWNRGEYKLPDMAFSLEGKVYISYFAILMDSAEHDKYVRLITNGISTIADKGAGSQLGDENLLERPTTQFMAPASFVRLESIRRKYDAQGRFHGYPALSDAHKSLLKENGVETS